MNKVGLLIKKDFIYLFTSLKRLILMAVIFAFIMPIGNINFSLVVPVMIAYLLTYGLFAYEEKNKMHLLNASLPVSRKEICLSKYLSVFMYIGAGLIITTIGTSISLSIQKAGGRQLTLSLIINIMALLLTTALIYHAVILPLLMYFGTIKIKYIMFIFYIGGFMAIGALSGERRGMIATERFLEENLNYGESFILVLIGIILYVISYSISIHLYERKEFK